MATATQCSIRKIQICANTLTRNRTAQVEATVTVGRTTIHPSTEAKYLGVTFDQKLKFHTHIEQIVAKATKYALAVGGIAKSRWGPEFKCLRRLFIAVATPRMDYEAIIWHRPKDTQTAPTTSQLQALSSVQGRIMRAITGCFRTTAITAMEHETALAPPKWRLTDKILQTITRMATTETNHPIQAWIKQALKHGGPPHMSNLGNLVKQYPQYIQPDKMEHISAYIRPPWWTPTISSVISAASKGETTKAHRQRLRQIPAQDLIIYTDGSGHNGHTGAAIYSPKTSDTKGEYVGTSDTHNVYAAELTAIQMAVNLFEEKINEHNDTYIFTDNQSAIQAVESPKRQSGQYIIEEILDAIDRIHKVKPTCTIHIEWVPGHMNIEGNEQADQAAKAAAMSNTNPPTIKMKSAQNRSIQSMTNTQWETEWKTGKENAIRLRAMSQYPGTTTGPKLYGELQRKHVV